MPRPPTTPTNVCTPSCPPSRMACSTGPVDEMMLCKPCKLPSYQSEPPPAFAAVLLLLVGLPHLFARRARAVNDEDEDEDDEDEDEDEKDEDETDEDAMEEGFCAGCRSMQNEIRKCSRISSLQHQSVCSMLVRWSVRRGDPARTETSATEEDRGHCAAGSMETGADAVVADDEKEGVAESGL